MFLKNCILEGSGLDFGALRPRFRRVWGQFFRYFHMILDVCAENLPSRFSHDFRRVCRELAENLPSHTTPVSIAALLRPRDVRPDLPRGVGRRWSPPGGFQSAAHRRCAKRARSPAPSLSDTLDPSQLANLKGQAHYAGLGS